MKKLWVAMAAVLLLCGCGGSGGTSPQAEEVGRLQVYASIYPMYDFTCKIAGDRADVYCVTAAAAEPHDWEPSPRDIVNLEGADLFIYNGAGMEHWVDTVLESLDNEGLLVVEAAAGLGLMPADEDGHGEEGHDHGGMDPHVWLSPQNAAAQMRAIKDALVEKDPANKEYYEENYEKWSAECQILDTAYREALDPLPNREIVVAHRAYGYLCQEYNLEQVAVRGFSPDAEPDMARMAEVVEWAREHQVKVIFFEEAASSRVAEVIAEELGVDTDVLYPIETALASEDYFSLMRRNLDALCRALG